MDHIREHRSLTADLERRLLIFIARRLPARITPDHLSMVGLLSMPAAACAFVAIGRTRVAVAGVVLALAANWFGDSLDGTLARVRNQQRPRYGYYVDHVIDLAGTAILFAGIVASGAMSAAVGMTLLSAYLLVAAETYLATHALGVFRLSFAGFGPTELRFVLATGAIALVDHRWVDIAGRHVRLFDAGGIVAIGGLVAAFVASALRNTRTLYRAEPLPAVRTERAA